MKEKLRQQYQERSTTVKKTKRKKKTYVEKVANEAEIAARHNNSKDHQTASGYEQEH